jgi:TRAP-type C4-dicarboxylate transport system permease large subunit
MPLKGHFDPCQIATVRTVLPFTFVLIGVLLLISYVPALTLLPVRRFGP